MIDWREEYRLMKKKQSSIDEDIEHLQSEIARLEEEKQKLEDAYLLKCRYGHLRASKRISDFWDRYNRPDSRVIDWLRDNIPDAFCDVEIVNL